MVIQEKYNYTIVIRREFSLFLLYLLIQSKLSLKSSLFACVIINSTNEFSVFSEFLNLNNDVLFL